MDEATLFRVCHAYQLATDHHQKHPPMGERDFGAYIIETLPSSAEPASLKLAR